MRRQIQMWGIRVLMVVLIVVATQKWGLPLYKQYFTPKKTVTYVPTGPVRAGNFVVSFHEIGTLEAEKSVPVIAEASGKIISLIADGTVVSKGEKLVEMDITELVRDVRERELSYSNAKAAVDRTLAELEILKESNKTQLEQSEAQLSFDQNELELAKRELEKQQRLVKDRLVAQTDVDRADLQVRSKSLSVVKGEKQLALAREEVRSKEKQKEAEVGNAKFAASKARLDLEEVQDRLKRGTILAPAGGLVVISKDYTPDGRRKLKEGDEVHRRQTICELPDLSSMLVKVAVGEADAPKVRINMPTLIRLEAIPNKVFHGMVSDVSSLATEPSPWETNSTPGRKNFEVTIKVREVDPRSIKPGMTADVEFIVDTIAKSTYVPIECVSEKNGATFVFVKKGPKYTKKRVWTGKNNDNFICVVKGVKSGQTVALRDPSRPGDDQQSGATTSSEGDKGKRQAAPLPGAKE